MLNLLNCSGNITSCCTDYGLARFFSIIKQSISLIQIIVPIILLVMLSIQFAKMMMNPDEKKNMKALVNKFMAAVLVFFLPTIVNATLNMLPEQVNIVSCWNAGDDVQRMISATNTKYIKPNNKKTSSILVDPSLYEKGDAKHEKEDKKTSSSSSSGTTLSGGMPIPLYYQQDYGDVSLKPGTDRTVATSGCGFTSTAMIVSYLTGKSITPRELVGDWSRAYYVYNVGMSFGLPQAAASHYNLGNVEQTTSSSRMVEALKNNQPVMSSQSAGLFTSGGHLIVLRGVTADGKILVNDPNKGNAVTKGYNNRSFSVSEVDASCKMYFIFPKKV